MKSAMGELTDASNRARGFSLMAVVWAIGASLGYVFNIFFFASLFDMFLDLWLGERLQGRQSVFPMSLWVDFGKSIRIFSLALLLRPLSLFYLV